jgi:hypothetical protein
MSISLERIPRPLIPILVLGRCIAFVVNLFVVALFTSSLTVIAILHFALLTLKHDIIETIVLLTVLYRFWYTYFNWL